MRFSIRQLYYHFNLWLKKKIYSSFTERKPEAKRLFLLRLDEIGDFIIWLDSAACYRKLFPGYEITLACKEKNAALAKSLNFFDRVITCNNEILKAHRSPFPKKNERELHRYIYRENFSIVINTRYSRHIYDDFFAYMSDAPIKIASQNSNNFEYMDILNSWYTQLLPAEKCILHEYERNQEFVHNLGMTDYKFSISRLPENKYCNPNLAGKKYFVLFPGASDPRKMWEPEKFIAAAKYIVNKTGWLCVICGTGELEQKIAAEIEQSIAGENILNLSGKTNLAEFIEVIRGAQILISNDTSSVHIAAAVRVQSVCIIYGVSNLKKFLPYDFKYSKQPEPLPKTAYHRLSCFGCDDGKRGAGKCISPKSLPMPCIKAVEVDEVLTKIDQILTESNYVVDIID